MDANAAGLDELQTLPGIGPVIAQHILDWRVQHGQATSVDQLREVSGIGDVEFAETQTAGVGVRLRQGAGQRGGAGDPLDLRLAVVAAAAWLATSATLQPAPDHFRDRDECGGRRAYSAAVRLGRCPIGGASAAGAPAGSALCRGSCRRGIRRRSGPAATGRPGGARPHVAAHVVGSRPPGGNARLVVCADPRPVAAPVRG